MSTAPQNQKSPMTPGQRVSRAWLTALLLAAAAAAGPARADEDQDRANLARLENELAVVQRMAQDYGGQQSVTPAVRFRYDWLVSDLQMMRDGIRQHLDAPRQPRPVPALRGDYRQ